MTILEKTNFVGTVFKGGVKAQLKQDWLWGTAASIGLYQGLKYKGDVKAGMTAGLAVILVTSGVNGLYNIVSHWDKIKEVLSEKEE